jgi:hypothetical protein
MSTLKIHQDESELKIKMSKQGRQNKNQTRERIEKQDKRNDIELGQEFQVGNSKSQSQKKSGKQVNKK